MIFINFGDVAFLNKEEISVLRVWTNNNHEYFVQASLKTGDNLYLSQGDTLENTKKELTRIVRKVQADYAANSLGIINL